MDIAVRGVIWAVSLLSKMWPTFVHTVRNQTTYG